MQTFRKNEINYETEGFTLNLKKKIQKKNTLPPGTRFRRALYRFIATSEIDQYLSASLSLLGHL